jgi:HNH endonuclease
MPTCIYCGAEFTNADAEHILQNALGARWKSKKIVCDLDQTRFGNTIDADLADRLEIFRNLFDVNSGRGGRAPTLRNLPTLSGKSVALKPGGVLQPNEPKIEVSPHNEDSVMVNVAMRDARDIGWVLHLIKEKVPNARIDADLIKRLAVKTVEGTSDVVKLELAVGGLEYHRAAVKSVFNLVGASGIPVMDACFDPVRAFVRDGTGNIDDFIRFAAEHAFAPATKFGPIDHFVAVVGQGAKVDAFLQYYGAVQHCISLARNYLGAPFALGYLVNPLRGTEPAESRAPVFDEAKLPRTEDHPSPPTEATWAWMRSRVGLVMDYYVRNGREQKVEQIIKEVLEPHDGELFTRELIAVLAQRLASAFSARE